MSKKAKFLTKILRHEFKSYNGNDDGFVKMDDIPLKRSTIENIVKYDNKERFEINGEYVKAKNGHSQDVDDEKMFEEIVEPIEDVYHLTFHECLESIKQNGLSRMRRTHIHFCKKEDIKILGRCAPVKLKINMKKCMDDGIKFFITKNRVILSRGIDGVIQMKYLTIE